MSVMWNYLDKRSAVIRVLQDFDNMQFIIENTDEQLKKVGSNLTGLGSPRMDGMPHAHNPQAGEDRLVEQLDKIDLLKERYRQAVEYMDWFLPAWRELTEDERYVLDIYYRAGGSVSLICDRYGIERSSAYNRKNRALDRLVTLLYGKG